MPLAVATVILAAMFVSLSSAATGAATSSSRVLSSSVPTNGVWPGVGKICEAGPGGASSVRGVGDKTINIAVFNDAANTIEPGLEAEFPQQAQAFADWCNASGGINGRKIVIDNRDAALFNAAQVTEQSCQSDFMAVGGGMALDQPSVPVREKCGLGQISGYVVSDASELASDQVDPSGGNTNTITSGWFGALAKAYPQAVKKAGMGGENDPSVLEPERKDEYGAEAQGWNVLDFQEPPISVTDWAPYIEEIQSKGVEALWPSLDDNIVPYFQAMTTAGYHPAFVILGCPVLQFVDHHRSRRQPGSLTGLRRDVVVATRDGLAEPLHRAARQRHAHVRQGRRCRLRRRGGCGVVALVGEVRLGMWRRPDGVVRAQPRRRHEELGCRRH